MRFRLAGLTLAIALITAVVLLLLFSISCTNKDQTITNENTPTAGRLKVYFDEGLALHVKNQAYTFAAQYPNVEVQLFQTSENEAVEALYNDSCEAIVISRLLNETEKKAFASKRFFPRFSAVAKSGIAIITNTGTALTWLSYESLIKLLTESTLVKDSLGKELQLKVLFDKKNSALLHYVLDTLLKGKPLSPNCNILNSSIESINYIASNKNTIALVDFAWLSDGDDSIAKANKNKIRFIALSKPNSSAYEVPSQSTFKLGTYPFTRTVYVIRKTGDFTLAKGFESFVAGPKGQLTFLKQGLLPVRQAERAVTINIERPDK